MANHKNAMVIPRFAIANEADAVADEADAVANGSDAVADGSNAVADGSDAVAREANAVADRSDAVAGEADAIANGARAVANGARAVANGARAIANGARAVANRADAMANEPDGVAMDRLMGAPLCSFADPASGMIAAENAEMRRIKPGECSPVGWAKAPGIAFVVVGEASGAVPITTGNRRRILFVFAMGTPLRILP
uniref:Uncharacterized protein n=1 Tax=Candidatus Kentrum sp. DK TaxID=2126562 RepID=A0A450SCU3_9GAMM|nr:MAG: hypothetical protein BECKDK2373B_GA0170837_102718 [Candidatus Kentron sp. DK]